MPVKMDPLIFISAGVACHAISLLNLSIFSTLA